MRGYLSKAVCVGGVVVALVACSGNTNEGIESRVKNAANIGEVQGASGGAATTTSAVRSTTVQPSLPTLKPRRTPGSTTTAAPQSPLGSASAAQICPGTAFSCKFQNGQAPFVLLAFGDSYGSGEGNPAGTKPSSINWNNDDALEDLSTTDYASRTNFQKWWWDFETVGGVERPKFSAQGVDSELVSTSWVCHRSSDSGVAKAVGSLLSTHSFNMKFGHFACSGAKSQHVAHNSYTPGFNDYGLTVPTQISQANAWLERQGVQKKDVDAAVVSIGGNDVGFADVIKECFILPTACHNNESMESLYDLIPTRITSAVNTVVNAVRTNYPNAKVFFTAYTDGIGVDPSSDYDEDADGVCSTEDDPYFTTVEYETDEFWDIRADDSAFVKQVLERINSSLQAAVSGKPNVHVVSDQFSSFRDNGFCTRGRRNITFNDEAVARQGADQVHASSGGWHPNDRGYGMYGDAIFGKLRSEFATEFSTYRR